MALVPRIFTVFTDAPDNSEILQRFKQMLSRYECYKCDTRYRRM